MNKIIIKHGHITDEILNEIIKIKAVAWPYPYEKQMQWIKDNIRNDDFHILYGENDTFMAYTNIVNINIYMDNRPFEAFGVGNVCALVKGKGYGKEVMKIANEFILSQNKIGVLFCKESLVKFYASLNWVQCMKEKHNIPAIDPLIKCMFYNLYEDFRLIDYKDRLF